MYHVKQADIVIIGSGAAGTMSAIYAHRVDPKLKVVVLDKSKMDSSGGAGRGMDALNTVALPPYSQPEDVVELLTKVTEGILDQKVAHRFGEICPRMVADLEQIMGRGKGDLFPRGRRRQLQAHVPAAHQQAALAAHGRRGDETGPGPRGAPDRG